MHFKTGTKRMIIFLRCTLRCGSWAMQTKALLNGRWPQQTVLPLFVLSAKNNYISHLVFLFKLFYCAAFKKFKLLNLNIQSAKSTSNLQYVLKMLIVSNL